MVNTGDEHVAQTEVVSLCPTPAPAFCNFVPYIETGSTKRTTYKQSTITCSHSSEPRTDSFFDTFDRELTLDLVTVERHIMLKKIHADISDTLTSSSLLDLPQELRDMIISYTMSPEFQIRVTRMCTQNDYDFQCRLFVHCVLSGVSRTFAEDINRLSCRYNDKLDECMALLNSHAPLSILPYPARMTFVTSLTFLVKNQHAEDCIPYQSRDIICLDRHPCGLCGCGDTHPTAASFWTNGSPGVTLALSSWIELPWSLQASRTLSIEVPHCVYDFDETHWDGVRLGLRLLHSRYERISAFYVLSREWVEPEVESRLVSNISGRGKVHQFDKNPPEEVRPRVREQSCRLPKAQYIPFSAYRREVQWYNWQWSDADQYEMESVIKITKCDETPQGPATDEDGSMAGSFMEKKVPGYRNKHRPAACCHLSRTRHIST